MKRKVKRYNGEEDSLIEDDEDTGTTAEFKRPIKSTEDAISETAGEYKPSKASSFGSAFAEARAKALKGGPKTFEWNGKTYGTALKGETKPKSAAPAKPAPAAHVKSKPSAKVEYETTPVKTSKEKIAEIKEQTPLRNPSGGLDFMNAAERSARVRGEAMKESARQARADRVRRNVGSNLETYGMKKGGKVSSASKRADGIAQRGKTKGRIF